MNGAGARLLADLAQGLAERRAAGLLRTLVPAAGLDLCSNDVLGYAQDAWIAERTAAAVRAHGAGAGAARLLRGTLPLHLEAEARLAAFAGREAALLLPSGYLANLALLGGLVGPDDRVLSDRDNHASLIDGLRLARATVEVLDLDDAAAAERALARPSGARRTLVVVESVVSTSGRRPDLARLAEQAERHGALLVVDEAHATGLHGARGSGRVEELGLEGRVLASVHTGGKALGVAGAWIAGPRVLIEHLLNHARPFLFTTAPPPAVPAGLLAALERLAGDVGAAEAVRAQAAGLRVLLRAAGLRVGGDGTHLVPVAVGDDRRAADAAAALQAEGLDVRALRPPTVRPGEASLRIVVRRAHRAEDLARVAARVAHHLAAPGRPAGRRAAP